MVQKSLGNSGRYLNSDWHETRRQARETTENINQWSPIDQTRYDLSSVDFDRKELDRDFRTEEHHQSEGGPKQGFDIRQLPTRD